MNSDSTVKAQNQLRPVADTGAVKLGANQELRLTVVGPDVQGNDNIRLRFIRIEYGQDTCNDGVCKQTVVSQTTSSPITLAPGEAASARFELTVDGHSVRSVVLSNDRNVRVLGIVFDTSTQRVVTTFNASNDPVAR